MSCRLKPALPVQSFIAEEEDGYNEKMSNAVEMRVVPGEQSRSAGASSELPCLCSVREFILGVLSAALCSAVGPVLGPILYISTCTCGEGGDNPTPPRK